MKDGDEHLWGWKHRQRYAQMPSTMLRKKADLVWEVVIVQSRLILVTGEASTVCYHTDTQQIETNSWKAFFKKHTRT